MNESSKRRTLVIAAMAALALGGCALVGLPAISSAVTPSVEDVDPGPEPDNRSAEETYADAVTDITQPILVAIEDGYPELYAGAAVDHEARTFTIYGKSVKPPVSISDMISAVPQDLVSIVWREAAYSMEEFRAASDAMPALEGAWSFGPSPDASRIQVFIDPSVDTSDYPKESLGIPIEYIEQANGEVTWTNTRSGGSSQILRGGQQIKGTYTSGCGTGPNVERISDGAVGFVTAAHCSAQWNSQNRATFAPSALESVSAAYPDTFGFTDASNYTRRYDAAYADGVRGSSWYPEKIWAHEAGTPESTRTVMGAYTPVIGEKVCSSGAFSGRRCNGEITAVEQTIYPRLWVADSNGGHVSGAVKIESSTGTIAGEGDSGSVVYRTSGSSDANVAGTMDAVFGTPLTCTGVQGRYCSDGAFYVRWKHIADTLGLRLIKG